MDKQKQKRRGPYKRKFLEDTQEVLIAESHQTEYTVDFETVDKSTKQSTSFVGKEHVLKETKKKDNLDEIESNKLMDDDDIFESVFTSSFTDFAESEGLHCQYNYEPVINDELDLEIDEIMKDLQTEIRERCCDELIDDQSENEVVQESTEVLLEDTEEVEKRDIDPDGKQSDAGAKSLYEGSAYTVGITVLLICCFIIRFRLPDESAVYLLRILVCLLPQGNRLMGTMYYLRKFLKQYASDMVPTIVYHCNFCYCEIDRKEKECPSCFKSITQSGSVAYFVQLKIVSQLQALWQNPFFSKAVRTNRIKHFKEKGRDEIKDIYDGKVYENLFKENGILSDPNNLSFSLNTDGVPLFKSSNISIWPIYLLVNELPISMRKQRDYSVFYGFWISSRKPQMWSFLKPLFEELKYLEENGHSFTDSDGYIFHCRCILLTCTCDLPARALVYNCNQFNGQYSCWYCLEKGETYKFDTGGTCHIFPYNQEKPKGHPRTRDTVLSDISAACENVNRNVKNYTVRGHKGPFWFMYLKHFDIINSCVIDYMHGVCLGIMRLLLKLWFDKGDKDKAFSCFHAREKVSLLLKKIQPAMFVTRIPRGLDDLTHWKSSEYRNFLLYWGVPVLKTILQDEYFVHFCLLSRSVFLLSKETITQNDLNVAEGALFLFVECFEKLYGNRYYTLNLHQLIHLVDCVRQTGPLFVNNCFIFEDLNGYIIKHIHGTQGVETQLVNTIAMVKGTPLLYVRYLKGTANEDALHIYHELVDSVSGRYAKEDDIEPGIRPVGAITWKQLTQEEINLASKFCNVAPNVKCFLKINMYRHGFYVYGEDYKKLQKRQQNVVTYCQNKDFEFCSVKYFVQFEDAKSDKTYNLAMVKPYKKCESIGSVWHVSPLNDQYFFIPIQSIVNVNNIVRVDGNIYICPTPNRYDRD